MHFRACLLAGLVFLGGLLRVDAQNLLINGTFADPVITPGTEMALVPPNGLPGWVISTDPFRTISLQSGSYAANYTNGQVTTQLLDLTGITGANGLIMQNVNSVVLGGEYHFSISNYNYGGFVGNSFQVTIESIDSMGNVVGTLASVGFGTAQGVLTTVGFDFTNTGATATTTFRVTIYDLTGFDSNASWIQNASIVLVPEPEAWGALGGVLALSLIWRRRRSLRREAGRLAAEV